jgi:lysozyme
MKMTFMDIIVRWTKASEGLRLKMYLDSKGIQTIGFGHNLRDKPISERAAQVIFEDDMAGAIAVAKSYPWFDSLNEARKAIIVDMCFNMGSIHPAEWPNLHSALYAGDWERAAAEMKDSAWYSDVGDRAVHLCAVMRSGVA